MSANSDQKREKLEAAAPTSSTSYDTISITAEGKSEENPNVPTVREAKSPSFRPQSTAEVVTRLKAPKAEKKVIFSLHDLFIKWPHCRLPQKLLKEALGETHDAKRSSSRKNSDLHRSRSIVCNFLQTIPEEKSNKQDAKYYVFDRLPPDFTNQMRNPDVDILIQVLDHIENIAEPEHREKLRQAVEQKQSDMSGHPVVGEEDSFIEFYYAACIDPHTCFLVGKELWCIPIWECIAKKPKEYRKEATRLLFASAKNNETFAQLAEILKSIETMAFASAPKPLQQWPDTDSAISDKSSPIEHLRRLDQLLDSDDLGELLRCESERRPSLLKSKLLTSRKLNNTIKHVPVDEQIRDKIINTLIQMEGLDFSFCQDIDYFFLNLSFPEDQMVDVLDLLLSHPKLIKPIANIIVIMNYSNPGCEIDLCLLKKANEQIAAIDKNIQYFADISSKSFLTPEDQMFIWRELLSANPPKLEMVKRILKFLDQMPKTILPGVYLRFLSINAKNIDNMLCYIQLKEDVRGSLGDEDYVVWADMLEYVESAEKAENNGELAAAAAFELNMLGPHLRSLADMYKEGLPEGLKQAIKACPAHCAFTIALWHMRTPRDPEIVASSIREKVSAKFRQEILQLPVLDEDMFILLGLAIKNNLFSEDNYNDEDFRTLFFSLMDDNIATSSSVPDSKESAAIMNKKNLRMYLKEILFCLDKEKKLNKDIFKQLLQNPQQALEIARTKIGQCLDSSPINILLNSDHYMLTVESMFAQLDNTTQLFPEPVRYPICSFLRPAGDLILYFARGHSPARNLAESQNPAEPTTVSSTSSSSHSPS